MTNADLREALHEVASVGVGQVDDARLARVADRARSGGHAPPASRRGGGRRWVVGTITVAAVALLVVVGVAQALRPVEVTPASGAGSLPDQIYPSREHILTMEQAPIGRVSMVFATSPSNADAAPASWIAVGSVADEYRWVAPVESEDLSTPLTWDTVVEVSPDGRMIAVGYSSDQGSAFRVEVIDASNGSVTEVALGESLAPLGGQIEGLSWSPSSKRLDVECAVVIERTSDTGRRWEQRQFMVDGLANNEDGIRFSSVQGVRPEGGDQLVGWFGESPVVLSAGRQGRTSNLLVVGGSVTDRIGQVDRVPEGTGVHALSPDGTRLAVVEDPTGNLTGDGRPWRLRVFDTTSGDLLWQNTDIPEDLSALVGWMDERTPVLHTAVPGRGRAAPLAIQVAQYPRIATEGVRVVGLGDGDGGYWVSGVALAADVLAAGEVRVAEPPHQPWYDVRTLGPTVGDWITDHPYSLSLMLITVACAALLTFRLSRRRRGVHSRSSA